MEENNQTKSVESSSFQRRHGHELRWSNFGVRLGKVDVLSHVSGHAFSDELTAVLGPSGTGKSVLLKTLSGRCKYTGEIELGGQTQPAPLSLKLQREIAFVGHKYPVEQTATVFEALLFAALFRLPRSHRMEVEKHIKMIVKTLGLLDCVDAQARYLSEGQARRLFIGIELIVCPRVVLLDEPLSGLDSFNAKILLECLRKIALGGASVLITIHQPSTQLFHTFDSIIVLSHGCVLLQAGPNEIEDILAEHDLAVPGDVSTPEWILDIAQQERKILQDTFGLFEPCRSRTQSSSSTAVSVQSSSASSLSHDGSSRSNTSIVWRNQPGERQPFRLELKGLLSREVARRIRKRSDGVIQIIASLCGALLLAIAFQGVVDPDSRTMAGFQSHVVSLMVAMSLGGTIVAPTSVLDFVEHRRQYEREFRSNFYRMASLCCCQIISEVCTVLVQGLIFNLISFWAIGFQSRFWYFYFEYCVFAFGFQSSMLFLASVLKDANNTKDFVGAVILPQALLCGFYVTVSELPKPMQVLSMMMQLTYIFRLSLEEEFRSCGQPDDREASILRCVKGLGQLLRNGGLYDNTSTLTTAETGPFTGRSAIEDFGSLIFASDPNHSFFHYVCWTGKQIELRINTVNETYCDVTTANVLSGELNPSVFAGKAIALTAGMRLSYSMETDNVVVKNQRVYLIYPVYDVFPEIDPNKTANYICQTMVNNCPTEIQDFDNQSTCVSRMLFLPVHDQDASGRPVVDGNTTGCRLLHSFLAHRNPENHCRHLALSSGSACSPREEGRENSDLSFSHEDLRIFHKVAIVNDLIDPTQLSKFDQNHRSPPCRDITEPDMFAALTDAGELGDLDPYCFSYLETNQATPDNKAVYWIAVIGITLVFRMLTAIALKRRSKGFLQ